MDFGDGVTVNLCKTVDRRNGDNGPKLSIPKSAGLQLEMHSNQDDARPANNVQVTLLHPKSLREMLAEMQSGIQSVGDDSNSSGDMVMVDPVDCNCDMQSTFGNKENIPNNEKNTDDAVFHTSLNEPIGPILKSAMESIDSNNEKNTDDVVFHTSLNEPIGPILKSALESIDGNRRMQSTFENKENIPNNETFIPLKKNTEDAVFHTSLNEPIGPVLKSALKEQQSPNKPTYFQHRESMSCGIEESTEVLLVNSLGCDEKYFGKGRSCSGTDSDVEVLPSEEFVDSDWSAANTATDELEKAPVENIGAVIVENAPQMCTQNQVNLSKIVNESTDQEISVGNSSCSSLSNSGKTGKDQLLKVIGEQATYIQSLESTIARYRKTYKSLLEHVDALRLALDVKNIEDGNVKLEANSVNKTPGSRDVINHN